MIKSRLVFAASAVFLSTALAANRLISKQDSLGNIAGRFIDGKIPYAIGYLS